jgi:hypothetical protein
MHGPSNGAITDQLIEFHVDLNIYNFNLTGLPNNGSYALFSAVMWNNASMADGASCFLTLLPNATNSSNFMTCNDTYISTSPFVNNTIATRLDA